MSMDLQVWSASPFELPRDLPETADWVLQPNGEYCYDSGTWIVLVLPSTDKPRPRVSDSFPEAAYVAYVSLEPIGASNEGYAMLERTVRTLARKNGGVWVDCDGHVFRHDEGPFW